MGGGGLGALGVGFVLLCLRLRFLVHGPRARVCVVCVCWSEQISAGS